jgi:hypothetical protein
MGGMIKGVSSEGRTKASSPDDRQRYALGAVDVLLGVEGGEHYRLVMNLGGVLVDGGGGLSAEVAVAEIEVESADVVGAVIAGELHAALDACDGV